MLNTLRQRLFHAAKSHPGRPAARRTALRRSPSVEAMEPRHLLTSLMLVDNPSVVEGTGGTNAMAFTVSLNVPAAQTVTVNYQTLNYTALAGQDYTASIGTLSFAPGETSKTVLVPVMTDSVTESNEMFYLLLSGGKNAQAIKPYSAATIVDDDTAVVPVLSISNPRVYEGNGGTTQLVFTLTLNTPVQDKTVSVKVSTLNGSATAGSDYEARSEVVTFAPGETTREFVVTVYSDDVVEGNESMYVSLSEANVAVKTSTAIGLILNDD